MKTKSFRYLVFLISLLSITSYGEYGIKTVRAAASEDIVNNNSTAREMYNFKVVTGEKLISTGKENVFRADILNNKNNVKIQFDLMSGYNIDDYIITGTDNSIVGSIMKTQPYTIEADLSEGENIIKIVNKKSNLEIYRFNIDYKRVKITGLEKILSIGDTNKIEAVADENECDNVIWSSGGTDSILVDKDGTITAVNSGIGNIKGILYDDKNEEIIGSIDVQINISEVSNYTWIKKDDKWYYINNDTKTAKTGWIQYNSQLYYLNDDGSLFTGWLKKDNKSYYFKANGVLARGWFKDNGTWYYGEESGAVKKGWFKDHGNWYYFDEDGKMQTSDIIIDGLEFKFNKQGELQLGEE